MLFTIPGRAGWKLIVQKNVGQTAMYDQVNDVVRIDLRHTALPVTVRFPPGVNCVRLFGLMQLISSAICFESPSTTAVEHPDAV